MLMATRLAAVVLTLLMLPNTGCKPCAGKMGKELTECEAKEAAESGEIDEPDRPLAEGKWTDGYIQEAGDTDGFTFKGADGKGSVLVEVRQVGGSEDTPIDVTIASTWNNDGRADPLEDFVVEGDSTNSLQFGSYSGRPFGVSLTAAARAKYQVRITFHEELYEQERYLGSELEVGDVFGRIKDGTDREEFHYIGIDGAHSATVTVEHLPDGPDTDLTVQLGSSSSTNTVTVIEEEGFVVARGETVSLTVGSAVEQREVINLVADEGPVPYRLSLSFGPEYFESEGLSHALEPGETISGRLRSGADEDAFTVAGRDGSSTVTITVEHSSNGNASSEVTLAIVGAESVTIPAGETSSSTVPLTLGKTASISLKANEGPAPYVISAVFD